MQRRIRVKGVRREEIDSEQLALVYYLMGKRLVQEKRQRAEAERKKRTVKEARS